MKLKSLLIALVALVAFGAPARAAYNSSLTIDPISFLAADVFNLTYEWRTAPKNSVALTLAYDSYGSWNTMVIQGQYRWYLPLGDVRKVPLEGFSLGPWVALAYHSWDGADNSLFDNGADFLIGAEASYKWVFDGFVLEPNLGFGFGVNKVQGFDRNNYSYYGVKIGYGW
ncbi:MAG: hypothetical protein ACM3U1_09050 [Chloroflexota bacterium]